MDPHPPTTQAGEGTTLEFRIDCAGCEAVIPCAPKWPGNALGRPAPAGAAWGFAAGTDVATATGWRPVEELAAGDQVLTFENGPQTLRAVQRGRLWRGAAPCPLPLWPLFVPEGAIGNSKPLTLLPEQSVLVASELAASLYGDPFVLMPARLLRGQLGIRAVPPDTEVEMVMPLFDAPEIAFANGAALISCPALGEGDSRPRRAQATLQAWSGPIDARPARRIARAVSPVLQPDEVGLFLKEARIHAA
jgi:hypothetical protein